MSNTAWSTLQYAKSLQAVGFNAAQAEAIAEGSGIQHHAMQDFVTKKELYEVRDQINQKIDQKFWLLDKKITDLDSKLLHLEDRINCMADVLTSRLFIRLGCLVVAYISICIGFITLVVRVA